jgi:hypothetical protein
MIIDLDRSSRTANCDIRDWSAAEYLDTPFSDDLVLRAIVCRLQPGKWQWSIISLAGKNGELISVGVEKTADAARQTATSEITKCLENVID